MMSRQSEMILNRAVGHAVACGHEYFTVEHVFWSLLQDSEIEEVLDECGADLEELSAQIDGALDADVPTVPSTGGSAGSFAEPSPEVSTEPSGDHPVATQGIQRLIQRALFHVQSAGKEEIQPVDLLVALFQAKESQAYYFLKKQGIERLDLLEVISHGPLGPVGHDAGDGSGEDSESVQDSRASREPRVVEDPLATYTHNYNVRAKNGKIDPLIGRQKELDRVIQTLCRRRKNNPLLVGEAGVGKTALAEGLALRIVEEKVPDLLRGAEIYGLDLGLMLAGAKFRGDFEQRMKKVLQALEKKYSSGLKPILFIDEIHTIIGAGAVSGGALDAANLLKPLLTQGEIRCIGSTTYAEYRGVFEKDHALARRFQKIDIVEPTVEEAVQILSGLKSRFEEHHDVEYTPAAIRASVELSAKHLTDRFLPDKAIDVMDEAGARARLKSQGHKVLDTAAIEEVISQIARIPERNVSTSQKTRLKNLERDLKMTVFGQNHAVDALVTAIRLSRSGLRSGDKPVGAFMFCGPTGVGKTELSKQLASCLGISFLRYDMSEYGEKHTVSRLIGAPPGYVGYEQSGMLTDAVLKNPHSVVLLDEIEKAHPDIWNILLQVMDHGSLTDSNGRKADFRNTIVILTSNVGSRDLERRQLGLNPKEEGGSAARSVEQVFSPEFRNRLDAIVYFNPLDLVTVAQVVGKQLIELESQLLAKGVELEVDENVRDWLANKGYDRRMGARPMARLIQDQIKKPLAEEILFGRLEQGGKVRVHLAEGSKDLKFEIEAIQKVLDPVNESAPVS